MPALVIALQDGHSSIGAWMNDVYARLDGNATLARFAVDRGAIAVLALGMHAGFEHGAQRMTGAVSNLRKVVIDAKLV